MGSRLGDSCTVEMLLEECMHFLENIKVLLKVNQETWIRFDATDFEKEPRTYQNIIQEQTNIRRLIRGQALLFFVNLCALIKTHERIRDELGSQKTAEFKRYERKCIKPVKNMKEKIDFFRDAMAHPEDFSEAINPNAGSIRPDDRKADRERSPALSVRHGIYYPTLIIEDKPNNQPILSIGDGKITLKEMGSILDNILKVIKQEPKQ